MLLLHLAAAPSVLAVYATAAAYGIALVQLGPSVFDLWVSGGPSRLGVAGGRAF